MSDVGAPRTQKGILGAIERGGNALPDPVLIFVFLIFILMGISALLASMGASVIHPATGEVEKAVSLFSPDNIQRLWVEMPKTFTGFYPLGYVLVVMLGAGVAERTGMFATAMRASVSKAPGFLLTPLVALTAMIGNLAADAAYVVLIPLAGVIYAAAGRHPIAGIAAAFAGVSGGFSANLFPGQLDALLFGITEAGVEASKLDPNWAMNIVGNWWFIIGMTVMFLPTIWFVTDRIIEPRLGAWTHGPNPPGENAVEDTGGITRREMLGLWAALGGVALVALLWVAMTIGPGTPLIDEAACLPEVAAAGECSPQARLTPFYQSLVGGFFMLFLVAGWLYGAVAGTVKSHRDIVKMMSDAMADLGYYLVLAFVAAHFVAMFNWSNLGLIMAVNGADILRAYELPPAILLAGIVLLTGVVNLFVGSASAKWALLAPIFVPMLMLLNISPEMTTAAYRVGDSATNIVTPIMVYFPLVLIYAQRWMPEFGLGSLLATMVPYGLWMLVTGLILIVAWVSFGLPLGPDAVIGYELPSTVATGAP